LAQEFKIAFSLGPLNEFPNQLPTDLALRADRTRVRTSPGHQPITPRRTDFVVIDATIHGRNGEPGEVSRAPDA
jgi:hypothetical protein